MKKALSKTMMIATLLAFSVSAFATEDETIINGEGKIEAVQADTAALKMMLADRLQVLGAKLQGGGDAKIGTVIDAKVQALQTGDLSSAELIADINEINGLINHVDNN